MFHTILIIFPCRNCSTDLAVLTIDASKKFLKSSRNNQSEYFDTLLDELAHKIPVKRECLISNKKFHYFDEFGQIAISIRIDLPTNETENTVPGVFSNSNNMILYKGITIFHTGVTNDLNLIFGFQPQGPWDKFKLQIIATLKDVLPRFDESDESCESDVSEIDEKLDFFMASWKIQTIKNESGRYARSRTNSRVDLIKLHNSQTTTLDFIKKLNEMMKEKYKIYGITRNETEQYMIVLDYYFNKRDIKKYGE
ncbi:3798_t:CDS:2, partial [Cetraspora pellucida]